MTQSVIPEEDRNARGITNSLVRLPIGVEGYSILTKALDEGLGL